MSHRLVFIYFLFFLLSSCNNYFYKNDLPLILGIENVEIKNSQRIDEWAGMHGDGFILEIYELSETTIQAFINRSSKNIPNKKENGKIWKKYNWSKIPIDSSFREIFIMCLNYSSDNQKLKAQLNEIKKLIEKEGVYCSFYYRPDSENPQNVQLFILDVKGKKIYAIDQQI